MWPVLCKKLGLDSTTDTNPEDEKFVPRFKIVHCPPSASGKFSIRGGLKKVHRDGSPVYDIKNPYLATVTTNRELHTGDSDRSCRHIEFQIGDNLQYTAGDHLGVFPENSAALVEQFAARLQADLEQVIALVPTESTLPANLSSDEDLNTAASESSLGPCTLRHILADAIDITTPPRKAVLKALAEYATDAKDKAELLLLAKDGDVQDKYSTWIKHDQRTILEVLNHFPSVSPPLPAILELLPRLAPRFYSISSSPSAFPGSVHITSVVVRFNTPTGREHAGVCSTWMADLKPGCHVPVFIRESSFKLPSTPAPVIMVGPGTGLAPFRGFLQEINVRKHQNNQAEWESMLFFGCRHRKHDYIYEDELARFIEAQTLNHLHVAFSREQHHKVYVQDKIQEPVIRQQLWHYLNDKNGYFYVCGDARLMAKAVHHALVKIVEECGQKSEEEANTYVENLQKSGHYLQDVWF
jgi:NADPH-ferrihemoprotein reductase